MKSRSMIFTLYGDYIRNYGGEIWIGGLIQLMEEFGFNAQAVRAAVSRMQKQGWLQARKQGNNSFYSMTKRGIIRLEEAAKRIYKLEPIEWDGKWRMLIYSIPEESRGIRDELRKELIWSGFGQLSNSCWITPVDLNDHINEMFDRYGIQSYADFFVSDYEGPGRDKDLIHKCWDLEQLGLKYQAFIEEYEPKLESFIASNLASDEARCFVEKTELVHEYRKFLFYDPGLPDVLLPQDWIGFEAAELFKQYYRLLSSPANRYFEHVMTQNVHLNEGNQHSMMNTK